MWVLLRYFFFASLQLPANNTNVVLTILPCCSYNTNDSAVSFFIFGEFKRSRRIQILASPLEKLNFKDLCRTLKSRTPNYYESRSLSLSFQHGTQFTTPSLRSSSVLEIPEQLSSAVTMPTTLIPRGRLQVSEDDGDPSSTKIPVKIVPRGRIHVSPTVGPIHPPSV